MNFMALSTYLGFSENCDHQIVPGKARAIKMQEKGEAANVMVTEG